MIGVAPIYQSHHAGIEIELVVYVPLVDSSTTNRTMLELKLNLGDKLDVILNATNRTMLELKYH